jgi:putative SOS response-associated peptidase YedK
MCGRFTQFSTGEATPTTSAETIASVFGVETSKSTPRFNIAPTQSVATILQSPSAPPQLQSLQWGLIPSWAKDPAIGSKLINARAETVNEKPSFRSSFRHRRCLILADGFYEWQQVEGSRKKQPYFMSLQDDRPFAFAGLYDRWQSPEGETLDTCTIITTTANELLEPIHERMPVILAPEDYELWLDPDFGNTKDPAAWSKLQSLLDPYPSAQMKAYPVSTLVNSPKNDTPECKQPIAIGDSE